MKRVFTCYLLLGLVCLFGCQSPELNQKSEEGFVLQQQHHEIRMNLAQKPYWEAVDAFRALPLDQQRGVWVDKLTQSLLLDVAEDQKEAMRNLVDFLHSPRFLQQTIREDYLADWGLEFQNRYGFFEGLALTIIFGDIEADHLREEAGIAYQLLADIGANTEEPRSESNKRDTNCNCSWGWSCGGTCDNWRCDDAGGCGFLLLGTCEYLCDLTGGL